MFVDIPQQCFAMLPQVNFPAIIWIFTDGEGDGIESRLSSQIFSTLTSRKVRILLSLAFKQTGVKNYICVQRSLVFRMGRMLTSWRSLYTLPSYLSCKNWNLYTCAVRLKGFLNQKVILNLCRKALVQLSECVSMKKLYELHLYLLPSIENKKCFFMVFFICFFRRK